MRGKIFTILFVALAPLMLTPAIIGQSLTTITNVNTFTTTATYTQTTESAVATNSMIVTTTSIVYDKTLTAPLITSGNTCHVSEEYSFDAKRGQHLAGTFSTDHWALFYILSDKQHKSWVTLGYCDPSYGSGALGAEYTKIITQGMLGTFGWDVPFDDTYWIVIETFAEGVLSFNGSIVLAEPVTTTLMATTNNVVMVTATLMQTSVNISAISTSQQQQTPGFQIPGFQVESIIIGTAIGFLVLIVLRRRRARH